MADGGVRSVGGEGVQDASDQELLRWKGAHACRDDRCAAAAWDADVVNVVQWDETFRFPLQGVSGKLLVKAYDYDGVGKDELIGTTAIKIHDLFKDGNEYSNTYHIKDKSKKEVENKKTKLVTISD